MLDAAADTKFLSGDLHGLANSYSMRGLYHWRKGQFEPAIAFLRKDLALSRQVGDQTGLAQTLANLAGLYGQMRQPKAARRVLEEARKIAATLKNPSLDGFVSNQTARLEKNTREMAKTGESFGPAAPCQCGSGKNYRDCCGRADFEPVGLPWNFGGLSQDIEQATTAQTDLGIKPTRLDWFLADWDQTKDRLSWFKVFPRPGWHEIHELPDMASIQLSAAREAAKTAKENPASYEWPLSALVMSVCALEAFINQVAFFLKEANVEAVGLGPLPFTSGPFAFQRSTELSKKWDILGRFLCPSTWPPSCWNEFLNIVSFRNELVHFKTNEYQQIIPPPVDQPKILSLLPKDFVLRKENHSWPFRILTAQLADWAVSIADRMFRSLRQGYAKRRQTPSDASRTEQ